MTTLPNKQNTINLAIMNYAGLQNQIVLRLALKVDLYNFALLKSYVTLTTAD